MGKVKLQWKGREREWGGCNLSLRWTKQEKGWFRHLKHRVKIGEDAFNVTDMHTIRLCSGWIRKFKHLYFWAFCLGLLIKLNSFQIQKRKLEKGIFKLKQIILELESGEEAKIRTAINQINYKANESTHPIDWKPKLGGKRY